MRQLAAGSFSVLRQPLFCTKLQACELDLNKEVSGMFLSICQQGLCQTSAQGGFALLKAFANKSQS